MLLNYTGSHEIARVAIDNAPLDPNTSMGSSILHRKPPASSASSTDPKKSRLWADRVKFLPRLEVRAVTLIRLLIDGLKVNQDGEPILPNSTLSWFKQIYTESEENGFTERVDVLRVTMEMFTTHKYITLQEYEDHIQTMAEQLGFTEGKVWKVLVCANLAVLLIDVAEMSALWEETSPEGRTLMIDDIALRFPKQFMTLDEYRGQSEAKVLLELRTQALVQVFLDSIPTDLAGWNTITMIDNVLRVNSPPDEEDIQGNKVHAKYLPLAAHRVTRLILLMPEDAEATTIERNLEKEFPLEKTNRTIVSWVFSQCVECLSYLSKEVSNKDLKVPVVQAIIPHEYLPEEQASDEPDSESDEDSDDSFDPAVAAQALAKHRGPKQARIWAIQALGNEEAHVPISKPGDGITRKRSTTPLDEMPSFRPRSKSPLFVRSASASVGPEEQEMGPYDFIKRASQRRSLGNPRQLPKTETFFKNRVSSLPTNGLGSSKQPTGNSGSGEPRDKPHRSLLDPQPGARKISFESRSPSIQTSSPHQASRKRPREPSPVFNHSPSSDGDEDDFKDSFTPKVDPEKLKRSRASAAARHSEPTEDLLNRIHGPGSPENVIGQVLNRLHGPARPPPAAPGRKGLGYAWSPEQEEFLIEQIEKYGPAWADLARTHCGPGGMLAGRDQAKLKDKARNLKEKMLREGTKLPRNFDMVTPQGNREQAAARMKQATLLAKMKYR